MQVVEGGGQRRGHFETLRHRQPTASPQLGAQRPRMVMLRIDVLAGFDVVGQLHDVVRTAAIFGTPNMQDIHHGVVLAEDRFKRAHAVELTFIRRFVFGFAAVDNLHRAVSAGRRSRQPDLAVTPTADATEKFVIRNRGSGTLALGNIHASSFP
jgi:hypothetical protein